MSTNANSLRYHRRGGNYSDEGQSRGNSSHSHSSGSSKYTYGVWKGTAVSYKAQTLEQDKSPHLTLNFSPSSGSQSSTTFQAQINVASTTDNPDLIYWLQQNWSHPLTQTLAALEPGFSAAQTTDGTGLSLDYIRTTPAVLSFPAGQIVQDSDSSSSDANGYTNVLSDLEPIIQSAISSKSDVYVFGSDYTTGIHDIHMNQGNTGHFASVVGQDGALVINQGGSWTAVFLAFAEQEVPTDNTTGKPTADAQELSAVVQGGSAPAS